MKKYDKEFKKEATNGGVDVGRNRHQARQSLTDNDDKKVAVSPSRPLNSYAKSIVN